MSRLLWRKMIQDMKRSWTTYGLCVLIVAIGFCGYSILELCYKNMLESSQYFYKVTNFCDGFAEVEEAPEAVVKRLEQIPGVARAEGRLVKSARIQGYDEDVELLMVSIREEGMNQPLLSAGDYSGHQSYRIIIGDAMGKARGIGPEDSLVLNINGKNVTMDVLGNGITPENIYMVKDLGDMFPSPETYDAGFMNYEAMAALYSKEGMVNSFLFRLENGVAWKDVKEQIEIVLKPYGCYQIYEKDDHLSVSMLNEEMAQLGRMSTVVPFLFLTVAMVILYITLSRLIEQQRTQIGTLLAMGISMKHIQIHYMMYGGMVGVAGGVLGGITGYLAAGPMADFYRVYFNLPQVSSPVSWSYLLIGTMIAGLFCGFVAWLISGSFGELSPAIALRPPAPKAAKISILERIPGFSSLFTVPGMMAVRSLARNRKRAALSLFGIAFAYMITAALVSMSSMFDVFIFDYWEETQRQDIMVQFNRPVDKIDALEAVRHPDIRDAEGVIDVAVTLRGPSGEMDCVIQGIEPDSVLCKLYNKDGNRVKVQEEGIVISEHMANFMNLGIGDSLEIKVMYPEEKISRVPVTNIINQYMGSTAYMSHDGVGKISEYRNVYTSVLLKAPLHVQEEVVERLKDATAVSVVQSRHERVKGYRDMMGSMNSIMGAMSALGVLIGCVVIYISSLISYEELKREVATLMALGLRDKQCLDVISTSQWLLSIGGVLLGIPMAMGVSRWIAVAMASDLYTLPEFVDKISLLQAMVLTFLSVAFSSRMILRKMRRISPVELMRERE